MTTEHTIRLAAAAGLVQGTLEAHLPAIEDAAAALRLLHDADTGRLEAAAGALHACLSDLRDATAGLPLELPDNVGELPR